MVDWEHGARAPDYYNAQVNTQLVGRQVAQAVDAARRGLDLSPKNIHLIGFSLGTHISGFAGDWLKSKYHYKIGKITGKLGFSCDPCLNSPNAYLMPSLFHRYSLC